MIFQLIQLKLSIVKLLLLPPSMGLIKLFSLLYDSLVYGYGNFVYVFKFFKSFLGPLNNPRNRETTLSFLQICQQIGFQWSQSISKKVIQGAKAVYDFTVYVSTEIGKHRHSLYLSISDTWRKRLEPRVKKMIPVMHRGLRIFVLVLFARFLYITVNYAVKAKYEVDIYNVIVNLMEEIGYNKGWINL